MEHISTTNEVKTVTSNHDTYKFQSFNEVYNELINLIDRENYVQLDVMIDGILTDYPNDIQKFYFLFADINNTIYIRQYSAKIISYLINPKTPARRNNIIKNIWSLDGFIFNLKSLVTTTISESDTVIRDVSSQIFSYIFGIEGGHWIEGIQEISNYILQMNSTNAIIGFLKVFSDILNLANFDQELKHDALIPIYSNIFAASLQILNIQCEQSPEYITLEVREAAGNAVYLSILHLSDKIIDDNVQLKIPLILQCIHSSFYISNLILFDTLHNILLVLVKKYYHLSPYFMGIICNYVLSGMAVNNAKYQIISISFWQKLADFEDAYQKQPTYKCDLLHLSRTIIENFFEFFVNILLGIDPNDIGIEDINDPKPHMSVVPVLQSIYKVEPDIVFEKCSQKILNLIKEQQSWVHYHAALLLIFSISKRPINNKVVLPFLTNLFDYVIDFCSPKYCAHLRETALYVLLIILKFYPTIITKSKDPRQRIETILGIMSSLNELQIERPPLIIIKRYSAILYNLVNVYTHNNSRGTIIPEYFERIYFMLQIMLNYVIGCENEESNINNAITYVIEAICSLIIEMRSGNNEQLMVLFLQTCESLNKSNEFICNENIKYTYQAGLCSVIASLISKLKTNISQQIFQNVLQLIFNLLQRQNCIIYSEGLITLSALVKCFPPILTEEQINHCLGLILQCLMTQNEEIIIPSVILLKELFGKYSNNLFMLQIFDTVFNTLFDLVMNNPEKKDIHPYVIHAIATMFDELSNINEAANVIQQKREKLEQLMTTFRDDSSKHINFESDSDIEYANQLYISLCNCYKAYVKNFYVMLHDHESPELYQIERMQLLELDNLAECILQIGKDNIEDELVLAFIDTARQYGEHCSRRNKIYLNRRKNHDVISIGLKRTNSEFPNLHKIAREAAAFIKNHNYWKKWN